MKAPHTAWTDSRDNSPEISIVVKHCDEGGERMDDGGEAVSVVE